MRVFDSVIKQSFFYDVFNFQNVNSYYSIRSNINKLMTRKIDIVKNVLSVNDKIAKKMRTKFFDKNVFVLNVMSSPGSGKTTVLQRTLSEIRGYFECTVIVGDICTTNDADRLKQTGVDVIQINTDEFGGDCHLTALAINKVVDEIDLDSVQLLIIENIGNLVCPAEFDIGEDLRVVVLSVTEGEDKPVKYPLMFRESDMMLLNKIDLLPHIMFNRDLVLKSVANVNPNMPVFEISAITGEGFDNWVDWLKKCVELKLKTK